MARRKNITKIFTYRRVVTWLLPRLVNGIIMTHNFRGLFITRINLVLIKSYVTQKAFHFDSGLQDENQEHVILCQLRVCEANDDSACKSSC